MDKEVHPTLYNACNYLSMLGLKLKVKGVPADWWPLLPYDKSLAHLIALKDCYETSMTPATLVATVYVLKLHRNNIKAYSYFLPFLEYVKIPSAWKFRTRVLDMLHAMDADGVVTQKAETSVVIVLVYFSRMLVEQNAFI